ncbi:hypothetical protein JST97_10520 [bacterium]|nr:hypothetical protein [bacterium]
MLLLWALAGQPLAQPNYRTPPRVYALTSVRGRTYRIEKTLDLQVGLQAALRLEQNFQSGLALLPLHARPRLRTIKFYVMQGPEAPGGGKDNGLAYYRPDEARFHNDTDLQWSHAIVCFYAQNYLDQSQLWAQKLILHELAHAYHLTHYPEQHPELLKAWKHALQTGLYRNLVDEKGNILPQAYALTNQLEYFAELSVMYFARCNYPPHDRAALLNYDPEGYAVIEKLWKVKSTSKPCSGKPTWQAQGCCTTTAITP